MANKFFQGWDGCELAYSSEGEGPAVILNDGVGCDHYAWPYLRAWLRDHFQVIEWNYRGHGDSCQPADPSAVTIRDHAKDLTALLDQLELSDAILIGHSMGVQVILEAYSLMPERVNALIPVCGSYQYPLDTFRGDTQFKNTVFPHMFRLMTGEHKGFMQLWKRTLPSELSWRIACLFELNGRLVQREDFQPYLEHMARIEMDLFARTLKAASEHSAEPILHTITVPTLVFAGERDGFTPPEVSYFMRDAIANAQICVVPGASHSAPIEVPELFSLRIEKFFLDHKIMP